MAFNFLAEIRCGPLLRRLYREGGDKSAAASRYVTPTTARYMRESCRIGAGGADAAEGAK